MTLPTVSEVGRFDRFNALMCSVTFAADISPEDQQWLRGLTDGHNRNSSGGSEKPKYRLDFRGNVIQFWRVAATSAPTRTQFNELLLALGIADPLETEPTSQPMAANLPKTDQPGAHCAA